VELVTTPQVCTPNNQGWRCDCRALGDADFKEGIGDGTVICAPDVRQVDLGPEDQAVVMASDGVWDMVDDQNAVNIVLASVQV
jgi:serine/threonine protein phosphatase PrpC